MANRLIVRAEDIEDLPEFNASGWNGHLDASLYHGKCYAYALNNQAMAVLPGKGNEKIKSNTSLIEHLMGDDIALSTPPELPYEGNLASYAKKQWQNMVERDGMVPVAPDENGILNVPKGSTVVFLAVTQKRDPISRDMKASRHWYRADRPREGTDDVTWSHWDGDSAPKRHAGMDSLSDPWKQCAFERYQPVGYFLVASKKALEGGHDAANITANQATPQRPSIGTPAVL